MKKVAFGFLFVGSLVASSVSAQPVGKGTGLRFLDPTQYRSIPLSAPPMRGTLPAAYDLSRYFPAPGDQGRQGSCVAWAVAYGLKSYQERRERGWAMDQSAHQFSPAALYNGIKADRDDCMSGSYIVDAMEALTSWGAIPLSSFAYDERNCDRIPSVAEKAQGGIFRISSSRTVNVQSSSELKSHIAAGFPVVIGMELTESFNTYRGGVYAQATGRPSGGHAMIVTGYDDSIQAFKVLNSWGDRWGSGGYIWISYELFRRAVREAYVAQDIVVDEPDPQEPNSSIIEKRDLLKALRFSQKPLTNLMIDGYPIRPVSIWLQLPSNLQNQISRVEYFFDHSTFRNPKLPNSGSNVYLASWNGYACVTNAAVTAFLNDGRSIRANFNLCDIWNRGELPNMQ